MRACVRACVRTVSVSKHILHLHLYAVSLLLLFFLLSLFPFHAFKAAEGQPGIPRGVCVEKCPRKGDAPVTVTV